MIIKKLLLLFIVIIPCIRSMGQGIEFQRGSWDEVIKMATAANKMIYLDVYTTWCTPCKMLEKNIFPDTDVGKVYNAEFINYKVDAEKGEGIKLAKKYNVSAYPTALFLSPDGKTLIYRPSRGYTSKKRFIHRVKVAIEERNDTMTWNHYLKDFKNGDTSKLFLEKFLQKAGRLQKNNDTILDRYIKYYVKGKPDSITLLLLYANTHTLDNKSVAIINQNADALHQADSNFQFAQWITLLTYPTLEKAINHKDEKTLTRLLKAFDTYSIHSNPVYGKYFYQSTFYEKTGQKQKLLDAYTEEAEYLMKMPQKKVKQINKVILAQTVKALKVQLKEMHIPDSSWASSINATIAQHPQIKKSAEIDIATRLNAAAWAFVENKSNIGEALKWSIKAMNLVRGLPSWPNIADTYANLLYLKGEKEKAIQIEKEAVIKADDDSKSELKATLQKMLNGL